MPRAVVDGGPGMAAIIVGAVGGAIGEVGAIGCVVAGFLATQVAGLVSEALSAGGRSSCDGVSSQPLIAAGGACDAGGAGGAGGVGGCWAARASVLRKGGIAAVVCCGVTGGRGTG